MRIRTILSSALLLATPFAANSARIAVLSDIHVTPGNACDSVLRVAVDEINSAPDIDVVVVDGDLSNEGSDEQLINVKSILDGIVKPVCVLPGNHENNWSQSATRTFVSLWGNDRFVAETDSRVLVGINCGPYMKMGDGHVKQEDLHWLDRTLSERVTPGKRVVSFNHYPLNADMDNYREYIKVLERYPVIAHVNGHLHHWKKYRGGGIDAVMVRALDMRNGDYGYSLMDIDRDSVIVLEKRIGHDPVRRYSWSANTSIEPLADDRAEQDSEYVTPDGFHISKIVADSASIFTRIGIGDGAIYYGTSLGDVKAVCPGTGELLWSTPTGASLFARPVPYIEKGLIYVPSSDKELLTLDAATGSVIRRESAPGPYVADGTIRDGALYLGGYKLMEKRDAATGQLIWRYDSLANYCQAAPAFDGDDIVFGVWDTNLYCLDTRTGSRRWNWNNGKEANMLGPGNCVPVVTADEVILVAPDRFMTSLDRDGKQRWRSNAHRFRESLGRSADGSRVYAKTMDGELVAVATGKPEYTELWTVDMGIGYDHAPCIVAESNGLVYCGSRRGIVTVVDPERQVVVASFTLGVSEINGIDVDPETGLVYVSLIEGSVWQIADLRNLSTRPVPAVIGR